MKTYSIEQAAKQIGISYRTLFTQLHDNRYPDAPGILNKNNRILVTREFIVHAKNNAAVKKNVGRPRKTDDETTAVKPVKTTSPEMERDETAETQTLTLKKVSFRTAEEALEYAGIDTNIWEVERQVVNQWEMGYKDADGNPGSIPLYQIKLFLRRKNKKITTDIMEGILDRIANTALNYAPNFYTVPQDPHMLEIAIFDHHMGKLAWSPQTGENYDLEIAERLYEYSVKDLLAKSAAFKFDKILLPIGNDFIHIDNVDNTTRKGTIQDVDGRLAKIMVVSQMALVRAIDMMQAIAPVEVVLVPGNHDTTTIWHTARFLEAWYRNNVNVQVDTSPRMRKYVRYGCNLLGFTHGNEEALRSLPALMATETPHEWAATSTHEWHTGHFHKRKETYFTGVDGHDGVVIRALPSLSGRDEWHYLKGYMGNKVADAFIWSKSDGLAGTVSTTGGVK